MNKKIKTTLYCLIIISCFFQTIQASQYNPNVYYAKPLNDEPFISNASITYSAGFANEAYDRNGKTVPFLQQYGSEDFLERFVNPALGQDNIASAGQGHISGQYHFKQYRFAYSKNIYHQLFFGTVISLQDITITNITPEFLASEYPLSAEKSTYLEQLDQIIPKSIHQSGIYNMNIYFGYSEKLTHFNHINSFSAMLLVDLSMPQSMSDDNLSIFQFPCAANYFFGYPIVGAIDAEINDIFSLGISGVIVPFQSTSRTIPINDVPTNNHLLFTDSTRAHIRQEPFFSGTIFTVIKKPHSNYSGTIAYCYSQSLKSHITTIGSLQFQTFLSSQSILVDGFSLGALLFQLDINCASQEKKLAPIISLYFSMPVVGKLYKKTYLFGGACNFKISYEF